MLQRIPKKRKLTKSEAKELAVFKLALNYLTKDHTKQSCGTYNPDCPACQYYVLVGMLEKHIAVIEY